VVTNFARLSSPPGTLFQDRRDRRLAGTFTRDETRHLAAAVAKLPDLWRKS
jgi:hypothetical protein